MKTPHALVLQETFVALPLPSGSPVQEAVVAPLQGTVMRHSFSAAAVQPSSLATNTSCSAQPEEEGSQPEVLVQLWCQGQSPTHLQQEQVLHHTQSQVVLLKEWVAAVVKQ